MEATYKTANGRLLIKVTGETVKDIFRQIAAVQDVFDIDTCGKCGQHEITFRCRVVDDNEYFEALCTSCGAALHYGQHKKGGTLFPKDWVVWKGDAAAERRA